MSLSEIWRWSYRSYQEGEEESLDYEDEEEEGDEDVDVDDEDDDDYEDGKTIEFLLEKNFLNTESAAG